jgi:inosine/xanthosine triphosphate pyrophosphatase family protein
MKPENKTQNKTKINQVKSILEELIGRTTLEEYSSIEEAMEAFEDIVQQELEDVCSELRVQADRRFTIGDSVFVVEVECDGKRFEVKVALWIVGEVANVREMV